MNMLFSFKRFGLLMQRFFFERGKRELLFWGITVLVCMYFRNDTSFLISYLMATGAIFISKLFREIHSKTQGIHYFMIPATQLEKITLAIVLGVLFYFMQFIIIYIIGNLLGTAFNNLLAQFTTWVLPDTLRWELFKPSLIAGEIHSAFLIKSIFFLFVSTQAVFLLGSVCFKRNAFLKTLISIFVFVFIISMIEVLLGSIFLEGAFRTSLYIPGEIVKSLNLEAYQQVLKTICYLFIPFIWTVSYFRLTEKEV